MMRPCPFERQIEDYLFHRLGEDEGRRFEEHYFSCPSCFRALEERDLLVRAVKAGGPGPLSAVPARRRAVGVRSLWPWLAGAAVVGLMVLGIIIGTKPARKPGPWMPPTDESLRGGAIVVLSPRGDVGETPAALEWRAAAPGLSYGVVLKGPGVDWSATATEAKIALPETVRLSLRPGAEYRWQVKAFASRGYLTANSDAVTFRIAR